MSIYCVIAILDFDGAANTQAIVTTLGITLGSAYAAKLCDELTAFGSSEWCLPAAGELNVIYQQLGTGGSNDIPSKVYWSSSEQKNLYAFEEKDILIFNNGILAPGEELFLEKFAERKEVDRWRVSTPSLLTAVNNGDNLGDIRATLEEGSSGEFSRELEQLFEDVAQRSTAFVDIGQTTLLACNLEFRKQVLTHKKLSNLCLPAGNKHLVILPGKEKMFAKALEAIGFIIGRK